MSVVCSSCKTENPDEARFCFACATPVSPASSRLERKYATALFADIVGSTALAEQEDPEVVRALIDRTFERVVEVIGRHGGTVEKFMGDGVLAVFGVPSAHEDDPERAVRAALEIQAVGGDISLAHAAERKPELRVRIGIEAGEVLADVDAAAGMRERMLTGDAVNTAARLQSAADPGTVVVGANTHDATREVAEYRELPPLALKGKARPVSAWQALRIGPPRRQRAGLGLHARLTGREEELVLLNQTFHRVRSQGRPALVTILGAAGVGKSRLVHELIQYVQGLSELTCVRVGRCLSYGNVSYSALADAVRTECGILEDDPPNVVSERAVKAVEELFGDRTLTPQIEALVGAARERSFGRDDLFDAWRRFLEQIARRSPLLLVLEDIHWADDGLLEFITHLAEWGDGPIAILTLARPELLERRPTWGGGKRNYAAIYLEPLTAEETATMLDDLLSIRLPDELRRIVVERSEGNPLFGEEIVRMLIDHGLIRRSDEAGWEVAGSVDAVEIPRSIQALIAARLDAMPAEEKKLLQDASVVGRTFWLGVVAQLSSRSREETGRILRQLRIKEVVTPQEPPTFLDEPEHSFRHVLIRDVAYDTMSKSLRADKHVDVARWIEEQAGERREQMAERLATHYLESLRYLEELGGDEAKHRDVEARAFRWARVAGDRSLRLWQQREAIRWLQTALDIATRVGVPSGEEANLWETYAHACEGVRPYAEVESTFKRALALYDEAGDPTAAGRVEAWLAFVAFQSGRDDVVQPKAEQALARLEPLGESRDLALALTILGWYHRRRGRFAEAEPRLRRATDMAGRLGDRVTQARAMVSLGKMLQQAGAVDEGVAYLEEGLQVARDAGDLPVLLRALVDLSEAHEEATGDYRRAVALMHEGLELAHRAGHVQQIAWMQGNLADYLFDMGRLDEAEPAARRGLEAARAVGESPRIGLSLDCVAGLHAVRGRLDQAERALKELRPIIRENPEAYIEGWEPLISGLVALGRGRDEEAARILLDGATRLGDRVEVWGGQNLLLECVRSLVRVGRGEEARPLVDRLAALAAMRVPPRAFLAWARGLLEKDPRAARELLEGAVERFEAMERRIELGRCLGDLAVVERRLGVDPMPTLARGREILEACGATLFLREEGAASR